ncbi:MAG TPA: ABC transporter permease [Streptosporangiaceae bacterium]|nr:ABC transporter permease [Streptosporangiaceae bacterium]
MIAVELYKIFRRARTWISLVLICALPLLVAVFVAVTHIGPPPGQGSAFLSAVLEDGRLYPAAALALVLPVFLPVSVAVVAGDSIAGEAASGTLRYLLVRPVSRTRLLVAKLTGITAFVLFAVVAVTVTSYLIGVFLLGHGVVGIGRLGATSAGAPTAGVQAGSSIISLSGSPLSLLQLAERVAWAVGFITVSMLGVASIALFLSTVADSALGAAIGALAALVASEVLVTLNSASVVQPYLPTRYWLAWIDFFRQPIFWRDIQRGFAIQAVYAAVFLAAAWANFSTKDITALSAPECYSQHSRLRADRPIAADRATASTPHSDLRGGCAEDAFLR